MSGTSLDQPGNAERTGSRLRGLREEVKVGTRQIPPRRIGYERECTRHTPDESHDRDSCIASEGGTI